MPSIQMKTIEKYWTVIIIIIRRRMIMIIIMRTITIIIIILIRHFLLEHSLGLSNSNYENVKRAISRGAAWGS